MISAMEQRVRHYWTLRSHDFGAVRKNELENEMGQKWLREIERLLPEKEHLRILDVGTGTGFFAVLLAQTGHQVEGIDLTHAGGSQIACRTAKSRYCIPGDGRAGTFLCGGKL